VLTAIAPMDLMIWEAPARSETRRDAEVVVVWATRVVPVTLTVSLRAAEAVAYAHRMILAVAVPRAARIGSLTATPAMRPHNYRLLKPRYKEEAFHLYAAAKRAVGEEAVFLVSPERAVSLELLFAPVFWNLSWRGRSSSCESRIRRERAGRKKLTKIDNALLEALGRIVDPLTRAGS
jgi:hypothetical protein